jgi:hypothetical protein
MNGTSRLRSLPSINSAVVRAFGTDLLTLRIDLHDWPTAA